MPGHNRWPQTGIGASSASAAFASLAKGGLTCRHRLMGLYLLKVYASNFDFLQYYAANMQKARFLSSSS